MLEMTTSIQISARTLARLRPKGLCSLALHVIVIFTLQVFFCLTFITFVTLRVLYVLRFVSLSGACSAF